MAQLTTTDYDNESFDRELAKLGRDLR